MREVSEALDIRGDHRTMETGKLTVDHALQTVGILSRVVFIMEVIISGTRL